MTGGAARPAATGPSAVDAAFRDIEPAGAAAIVAAVCDLALVVSEAGEVLRAPMLSKEMSDAGVQGWIGRRLVDLVTPETRPKAEALLAMDSVETGPWRQVNHVGADGTQRPVVYRALRLASSVLLLGRDQSAAAETQRRLVAANQELERDYERIRQLEARFRHVFHASADALLILDPATHRVRDANQAAEALFRGGGGLLGRSLLDGLEAAAASVVSAVTGEAMESPSATAVGALRRHGRMLQLTATHLRYGDAPHVLLKAWDDTADGRDRGGATSNADRGSSPAADNSEKTIAAVDAAPEGFVIIDAAGRITRANRAFVEMVEAPSEASLLGDALDQHLGRSPVDCDAILAETAERGALLAQPTVLRRATGGYLEVDASGPAFPDGGSALFFRASRPRGGDEEDTVALQSVDQVTQLVGRVPLKSLVRDTTDVIERLCIEAALKLTGDNRASAAEMLGLSRQSLYVKLRRFGMIDGGDDEASGAPAE